MATVVVHALEVVEVDEDERQGVADAFRSAPLERELIVERAPVREARQAVGRRLRRYAAEVAERVEDRTREGEGDEDEECEGAEPRVQDALLVGTHVRLDCVVRAEREEADADCVRYACEQAAVGLLAYDDGVSAQLNMLP